MNNIIDFIAMIVCVGGSIVLGLAILIFLFYMNAVSTKEYNEFVPQCIIEHQHLPSPKEVCEALLDQKRKEK